MIPWVNASQSTSMILKIRPQQNELATHCHKYKYHNTEKELEVFIIDYGIPLLGLRKLLKDKYI